MLSKLLRQQENWGIPYALEISLQNSGFEQLNPDQLPALKNELLNYWSRFKSQKHKLINQNNHYLTGRIDKILHNNERGADGFIKYENKSVYFKLNPSNELLSKLKIGMEVRFKMQPPKENGKKGITSYVKPMKYN